jgi:ankyrin repeat protein
MYYCCCLEITVILCHQTQHKPQGTKPTMKNLKHIILLLSIACTMPCFAGSNEDLIAACMQGDLDGVKKAVDAGADVNFVTPTGGTPLSSAVLWPEIEKLLLAKKADPNAGKQSALQVAASYGSMETVKLLLNAGADPNKGSEIDMGSAYEKMALAEEAKEKPNKTLVKTFRNMADKAKSSPAYTYPISSAVMMTNNAELIEMLLTKGAKPDKSATGSIVVDYAAAGSSAEQRIARIKTMTESLEKAGMKVPDWYKNPELAKMSSPDAIMKAILKSGININGANPHLIPFLFCIQRDGALKADEDVVMAFLTNGAKFDMEESNHGRFITPILRAAALGYNKVLGYMLDHGADQNAKYKLKIDATGEDMDDVTPLMYAALNGNLETVQYLIQRGANFKTEAHGLLVDKIARCRNNVKNKNVIYWAIESGNPDLVKYLWEETKYDWNNHRLDFQPIIDVKTSNNVTTTTAYAVCHNGFTGQGPSQWAAEKGFKDIEIYIKSK